MVVETALQTAAANSGPFSNEASFTQYVHFYTDSAPGCSTSTGVAGGFPLEGTLADLTRYVGSAVPEDGESSFYRGYDLGFLFNENYVELMYLLAGTSLEVLLVDRNGLPVLDAGGNPVSIANAYGKNPEVTLTTAESMWLAFVNGSTCLGWNASWLTGDDALVSTPGAPLAPLTRYEARLGCPLAGAPLAKIVFGTSAFIGFAHHIQSGFGDLWPLAANTALDTTALDAAARRSAYASLEALLLPAPRTDPALRIDLSQIVDAAGLTRAILIESPEPIEWRRLSIAASHAGETAPMPRSLERLRFTACRLAPGQRPHHPLDGEWIELIARRPRRSTVSRKAQARRRAK